jgi:hypothetical protein
MKRRFLVIGLVLLLIVSLGCAGREKALDVMVKPETTHMPPEDESPIVEKTESSVKESTPKETSSQELEQIKPGTILDEKPPSYPDANIYSMTPSIKGAGYLRDGLAYLRNEGASGSIKVTIVPIDRNAQEMTLPQNKECLDNEKTIFVEADKSVKIHIVRYVFTEPDPCGQKAIFTDYESYNETETVENEKGTFHFQGELKVKLVGTQYELSAKAVGIYAYPNFVEVKRIVNGEVIEPGYMLDGQPTHVKVW